MKTATSLLLLAFLTLVSADNGDIEKKNGVRRRLKQSQSCILQKVSKDFQNSTSTKTWQCELQGSDAKESGHMFVNIEGLDEKTISGVRSGDYTLLAEDGEITSDGILKLAAGGNLALSKMEKSRGPAATARAHHGDTAEDEDQQQRGSRELNSMRSNAIKQRRVLAVRVRASDSVTTASDAVLSDKIFGTNGDSNNLRERFATCSYGETQMIPFNGRTRTGVSILNGVYSVAINRRVTSVEEGVIRDAVSDALTRELGDLPSQFDHVMLCLPPKTNGDWIGYAYVGGWLSVFNNEWCTFPSLQVHEIGHNLRLQHAGENQEGAYKDEVGLMGVSYGDDTTRKCYSLTASWELGWCRRRTSINFGREPSFRGNLIGIVDYENPASNGKFVIVRAQSSTNTYEVYVGFNLAKGFNMDTIDGKDEATVTIHEDEGESTLMAGLNAGGSYRIADFQGKKGLNIKVHSINRNTVPAYADVEIYIDGCPVGSRSSACNACISNNDCIRGHSCVVGTCAAGTIAADPGDTFSLEYSSSSSSRGTTTNNFQTIRTFTMVMADMVPLQGESERNQENAPFRALMEEVPLSMTSRRPPHVGFTPPTPNTPTSHIVEVPGKTTKTTSTTSDVVCPPVRRQSLCPLRCLWSDTKKLCYPPTTPGTTGTRTGRGTCPVVKDKASCPPSQCKFVNGRCIKK